MFDSIVSRIVGAVCAAIRVVRDAVQRSPWLAPAAIVALFLVW